MRTHSFAAVRTCWELLYVEGRVSVRFPLLDQSHDQTDHSKCHYAPKEIKARFIAIASEEQDAQ